MPADRSGLLTETHRDGHVVSSSVSPSRGNDEGMLESEVGVGGEVAITLSFTRCTE